MPRIMIKGVIWNKAQDNILKAGVLRYGENQWERIIALLPGKTVKQCKDRWEVGLNESIKKTEWTPKEDDKLLQLVILMPAKWQNIASIIRRTAVDCFNRHDYLLNRAHKEKEDDDVAVDPKKLVQGRIKSSCADLKCIYEDGLEVMLSEARANLANSQAKKTKLLAREKRLEVARRFAYVRRQRERIKAEEIFRMRLNLDTEISSDSQSTSCFDYSSTGYVDPLNEIQQQRSSAELRTKKEETGRPRDEQKIKQGNGNDNLVEILLGDDVPLAKRRKVIAMQEPTIDYGQLQQVVELRMHFEATGRITLSGNSLTELTEAQKGRNHLNETESFRENNNNVAPEVSSKEISSVPVGRSR